ncbi:LysR family transcriptional regulator [Vibrio taketomensis]|uniref:LysR family transcriptional regulator n=1 Tax=Vibrio taketomensis TaxID=2572923 RepID=UPI001389B97B|nr:LysR family transcriptional regulator [Vibrio taketomensis]
MKEISALPLLAKVVELNSFAEAARQLGVPTTTVSRKIQQLEAELGGKLLNRSTRSLSLTELGVHVLPKAQLIADTVSELYNQAEEHSNQPVGTLTITAPHAFSQDILAPLLAEFSVRYPTIKLNLSSSNRFQDLTKQNIDFAFRLGPLHDSAMIAMNLSTVPYVIVGSHRLIKRMGTPNHPMALFDLPCIRNHVDGYFLPWRFENNGEIVEVNETPSFVCDDFYVTQQLVLSGAGFAYLPASLFRAPEVRKQVHFVLQEWVPQNRNMLMVYQDRKYLPLKSQLFIEFIRENQAKIQKALEAE